MEHHSTRGDACGSWHLNRGNDRREIFEDVGDYEAFVRVIKETQERVPMRLEEASAKLARRATLLAARKHLRALPKERYSQKAFREGLLRSEVYRRLAAEQPTGPSGHASQANEFHCAGQPRQMSAVLSRAACGAVHVEHAEVPAPDVCERTTLDFERLWRGLPLSAVRGLTPGRFPPPSGARKGAPGEAGVRSA